jgi:hypothetical protein
VRSCCNTRSLKVEPTVDGENDHTQLVAVRARALEMIGEFARGGEGQQMAQAPTASESKTEAAHGTASAGCTAAMGAAAFE